MLKRMTLDDLKHIEQPMVRVGGTIPTELHTELVEFCEKHSVSQQAVIQAGIVNFLADAKEKKK